jgi:hypothetical protein
VNDRKGERKKKVGLNERKRKERKKERMKGRKEE